MFMKVSFEKGNFEKIQQRTNPEKFPSMQRVLLSEGRQIALIQVDPNWLKIYRKFCYAPNKQ